MPKPKIVPILILFTGFCASSYGQTETRTTVLRRAATEQAVREKTHAERLQRVAREKRWPLRFKGRQGEWVVLTDIDAEGYPIYTTTESNIAAAATIGTNKLWPGGGGGLSLSGTSAAVRGKLGVWDGGQARATHAELNGRINNRESVAISDHTTHVAGTLIASGVNPQARGMSFGQQELVVYDFSNNISEMLTESGNNMLVSNHSYGTICGWYQNPAENNRWEFRGQSGANEDYKFGFYNNEAEIWDSIAYNAPFHLIVKSAGNNRNQTGPAENSPYWRYNSSGQMINAGNRPAGISNNDGYDIIPTSGTAKNVLTVGAIAAIPSGYSRPEDAVIAPFSSWGPTDDGRIKPDVVADGVNLFSSIGTGDNAYATYSGTSMASPAAAGSLLLLQEHYAQLHAGNFMRSATLKALVIHTADEAGPAAGPDYKYGWGVINMVRADQVITGANNSNAYQILEHTINNGETKTYNVVASGKGILAATLCWTDPRGIPHNVAINNPAIKLIHDLDIRIQKASTTYLPWVLNPSSPDAPATKGDNIRDNVEKIEVTDVEPGGTYTITITHKGATLARGSQAFSLILSGVGGTAYCKTSAPTTPNGARLDSVSFAGIRQSHPAGCQGYNNFTQLTGVVEPNSTVPLYVRLNACAGGPVDKIVKAWIDFNNDGDFEDAGELLATSGVINGDGVFTTNVTIPGSALPGNYGVLRLIVQETANAGAIASCGPYSKGETQDYRIRIAPPSNDVGIAAMVSPLSTGCSYGNQYVTIRFRNYGSTSRSNIVLSGTVKDGANIVANLAGTYAPAVAPLSEVAYTFQSAFPALAGRTYTIDVQVTAPGDQYTGNDELTTTLTVNAPGSDPVPVAEICNSNTVQLAATNADGDAILWYESAAATAPIAAGSPATTTIVRADKTYYAGRNDLTLKAGPATKGALGVGSYGSGFAGNFMKFTSTIPLTIETIRLYTGNPGKVTITVADFIEYLPNGVYRFSPISSTTLDVQASRPGAAPGDLPDYAADAGLVYAVNLPVPEPGDHILILQVSEGATVFRNNGLVTNPSPYPFSVPGVLSITGNSAGGNTGDVNQFRNFYYFFYDMQLRLNGCASVSRVPVVATTPTAPVITMTSGTFTSSVATGNQWYLDNTPIAGATGQTHIATQNGVYKSVVTTAIGCELSSNEIVFDGTGVDPSQINLQLMPNPNNGRFTVDFIIRKKADVDIRVLNMLGQKVYSQRIPQFIGHYNQPVYTGPLTPGVYILQVVYDGRGYEKKMFVR